ncbi:hypothetical protein PR048_032554 [Dryococelus australis]|uniref:Uncharacterized protein n=1 Tax=Dryococelus australis TaxID=614101 RepID=A0ABQ9G2I5_9NEOP|nr:hypothetical protein PR048_032554 [Dryococelus australis]
MKGLNYQTSVEPEEELPVRVMAAADLGRPVIGDCVYQNMVRRYRVCVDVAGRYIEPFFPSNPAVYARLVVIIALVATALVALAATVALLATWSDYPPATEVSRVRCSVRSLPVISRVGIAPAMQLFGGFSRRSRVSPALSFRQPLVHSVFDTFWRTLVQSSPSTVTANNQCAVNIHISVHKTVEPSLQVYDQGAYTILSRSHGYAGRGWGLAANGGNIGRGRKFPRIISRVSDVLLRLALSTLREVVMAPKCRPWLPNPSLPRCMSPCMIFLPCRRKGLALRRNKIPPHLRALTSHNTNAGITWPRPTQHDTTKNATTTHFNYSPLACRDSPSSAGSGVGVEGDEAGSVQTQVHPARGTITSGPDDLCPEAYFSCFRPIAPRLRQGHAKHSSRAPGTLAEVVIPPHLPPPHPPTPFYPLEGSALEGKFESVHLQRNWKTQRPTQQFKWLYCLPPTKMNLVRFPAGSHPEHVGIAPDDATGRWVFSGISHFPPPWHSCAAPFPPSFTLIGSQDLVKDRPSTLFPLHVDTADDAKATHFVSPYLHLLILRPSALHYWHIHVKTGEKMAQYRTAIDSCLSEDCVMSGLSPLRLQGKEIMQGDMHRGREGLGSHGQRLGAMTTSLSREPQGRPLPPPLCHRVVGASDPRVCKRCRGEILARQSSCITEVSVTRNSMEQGFRPFGVCHFRSLVGKPCNWLTDSNPVLRLGGELSIGLGRAGRSEIRSLCHQPSTATRLSLDQRMDKVMRPLPAFILHKAEEQVDLKQGFKSAHFTVNSLNTHPCYAVIRKGSAVKNR